WRRPSSSSWALPSYRPPSSLRASWLQPSSFLAQPSCCPSKTTSCDSPCPIANTDKTPCQTEQERGSVADAEGEHWSHVVLEAGAGGHGRTHRHARHHDVAGLVARERHTQPDADAALGAIIVRAVAAHRHHAFRLAGELSVVEGADLAHAALVRVGDARGA